MTEGPASFPGAKLATKSRASGAPDWRRLPRAVALARLLTEPAAQSARYRSVALSGVLVAFSGLGSIALVAGVGAPEVADLVALRLLAYACWLFGLAGLPALLDPVFSSSTTIQLARLRGAREPRTWHRALGLTLRLSKGLLVASLPGLVLAAAIGPTASSLASAVGLGAWSTAYVLALAAALGLVGAAAQRLAPKYPRRLAVALLLFPFAASFVWPSVPSLPGVFLWGFERLFALRGMSV